MAAGVGRRWTCGGREWHDDSGQWYRSHGNENWEFNPDGLRGRREASINDIPIREEERRFRS